MLLGVLRKTNVTNSINYVPCRLKRNYMLRPYCTKCYIKNIDQFSKEQSNIVKHKDDFRVVLGGPGTGKTKCLISRIIHLVNNENVNPSEILALTPNNNGAKMIQDVLSEIEPNKYNESILSFHSFSSNILGNSFVGSILSEKSMDELLHGKIISSPQDREFFNQVRKNSGFSMNSLLKYFGLLRKFGITPEEYQSFISSLDSIIKLADDPYSSRFTKSFTQKFTSNQKSLHEDLLKAYITYNQIKNDIKLITKDDLLILAADKLKNESIIDDIVNKYKHILVDDVQDLTKLHYILIEPIIFTKVNKERTITLFGDDDQRIFEDSSASLNVLKNIIDKIESNKTFELTTNYRNEPRIIEGANKIISKSIRAYPLKNIAFKEIDQSCEYNGLILKEYETAKEELNAIATMIQEIKSTQKDASILIGIMSKLDEITIMNHLRRIGIISEKSLTENQEISYFYKTLSLFFEPSDETLLELLSSGYFSLPPKDLSEIIDIYNEPENSHPLLAIVKRYIGDRVNEVPSREKYYSKTINLLKYMTKYQELYLISDLRTMLYDLLVTAGIIERFEGYMSPEHFFEIENLHFLFRKIGIIAESINSYKSTDIWPHLKKDLSENTNEYANKYPENVVCTTDPAKAKPYEYDYVFIIKAVHHVWPGYFHNVPKYIEMFYQLTSVNKAYYKIKEDDFRKVFYSLISRAKKGVIMTRSFENFTGNKQTTLSPFVIECLDIKNSDAQRETQLKSKLKVSPLRVADLLIENDEAHSFTTIFNPNYFSLESFYMFNRCPLQYYYKYNVRHPEKNKYVTLYQKSIQYFLKGVKSGEIDRSSLGDYQECKAMWDQIWKILSNDERYVSYKYYDKGLKIVEMYREFDKIHGEIKEHSIPWTIEIPVEGYDNPVQLRGEWDRIFIDGKIRHFFTYYETKSPSANDIKFFAQTLAYVYKKQYNEFPTEVIIEYIYKYELSTYNYTPVESDFEYIENTLTQSSKNLIKGTITPKPSINKCLICQFNNICTSSALMKSSIKNSISK